MASDLFSLDTWSSFTSDADIFSSIVETAATPEILSPSSKKITKRKSRATKRSATTYITADVSNFREMVQQVTGVQFTARRDLSWKPAPKISGEAPAATIENYLPTLDTSSFLLESAAASSPSQGSSFGSPAVDGAAAAYELDIPPTSSFHCFPTLESWRVM